MASKPSITTSQQKAESPWQVQLSFSRLPGGSQLRLQSKDVGTPSQVPPISFIISYIRTHISKPRLYGKLLNFLVGGWRWVPNPWKCTKENGDNCLSRKNHLNPIHLHFWGRDRIFICLSPTFGKTSGFCWLVVSKIPSLKRTASKFAPKSWCLEDDPAFLFGGNFPPILRGVCC